MRDFDPMKSFHGADFAACYDEVSRGDEADTVQFLRALADGRAALELAVGTGRIAVPLAATGIRVDGIEQSADMISVLSAKPGADRISVIRGDMADVPVDGTYGLIYLVFNTIYNLLTQDDQVRCFENVARHLEHGGVFVVEAAMPGPRYCLDDQYVHAESVEVDEVTLDVGRYDRATQLLDESHVALSARGIRVSPIVTRFVWPAEMDLMARIAGLRLHARWAGWKNEPFDGRSARHVSVFGR